MQILALTSCLQSVDALRGVSPASRYTTTPALNFNFNHIQIYFDANKRLAKNSITIADPNMADGSKDRADPKDGNCLPLVGLEDDSGQALVAKPYQRHDRYRRQRATTNIHKKLDSEEESMALQALGRTLSRKQVISLRLQHHNRDILTTDTATKRTVLSCCNAYWASHVARGACCSPTWFITCC